MSEPEDVLLDAAHHATVFARRLWSRYRADAAESVVRLVDVRPRLEVFTRAVYDVRLPIVVAEPPHVPTLLARLVKRIPRHLLERRALPSTDGSRLRLPRCLADDDWPLRAAETYRILSLQLAARVVRGTPACLPAHPDRLVRDLFLIREASAVEAMLGSDLPGLRRELSACRQAVLKDRPPDQLLTPRERAVEEFVRDVLSSPKVEKGWSSEDSLEWATREAGRVRSLEGTYRGLPSVELWGRVFRPPADSMGTNQKGIDDRDDVNPPDLRVSTMVRRPEVRSAPEDEDDEDVGMWMIQLDDPQEHVEDPMGLQRPADRDEAADPAELADSLSELPEARLVPTPNEAREVLASDDPPPIRMRRSDEPIGTKGIVYPEWDYRSSTYRLHGATVREAEPRLGETSWSEEVLARRAALLQQVRRRFERLRPRRRRMGRQIDGSEVDIAAYVTTFADRAAGRPLDDRLYEAVRPARRDLAICLLVDVSASTDSWVSEDLRIIDVEKEALLIVCDALDALGDSYAILAFSGSGPEAVTLLRVKSFDGTRSVEVRRRIAALEPQRYTRVGAAIRHATAVLLKQPAQHRLLLVLSDGKPNDVDRYEGRYGVEDARQSVVEARMQGLHPFCLTVDRHAPAYIPRIFGGEAYAVLHHPQRLPTVLVEVLRHLVLPV